MKNLQLPVFLLCLLLFASCRDKSLPTLEDKIMGSWIITDATLDGDVSMTMEGVKMLITQEGQNKNSDMMLNFSDDDEYITIGNLILSVDYYMAGDLLFTEEMNLNDTGVDLSADIGTWRVENDQLILDDLPSDDVIFTDDDQIIININSQLEDFPINETGSDLEMDMDMNIQLTFTKL